jgi:hypothetical protein
MMLMASLVGPVLPPAVGSQSLENSSGIEMISARTMAMGTVKRTIPRGLFILGAGMLRRER